MNISNNFVGYNYAVANKTMKGQSVNNFGSDKKPTTKQFLEASCANLLQRERYIPENGKMTPMEIAFDVPGSVHEAFLRIQHDPEDPKNLRNLLIGVNRANSDVRDSFYIQTGTKAEILEYLKKTENDNKEIEKLETYIQDLLKGIDD